MLTIAPLRKRGVKYYHDTLREVGVAVLDRQRAGGGLGEYYTESETRTAVWVCAGDVVTAAGLVGLSDVQRAGGEVDLDVVERWLDDGIAPNGAAGRAFSQRDRHGFDLTFCAPKSVSVLRALDTTGVVAKAVVEAHNAGIAEAMQYLHAHAGYTRVHNKVTGMKDLVRLPGLIAAGYQHETSRAGDPHLHTHVLVFNKQPRADGKLAAIDSDSLWHEAKAAGIVYQATVRRVFQLLTGLEWGVVDAHSGMAEVAGIDAELLASASQRSTQLRQWAAQNLVVEDVLSAAQLAAAQKATRPRKPEHQLWADLTAEWAQRFGGELVVDPVAQAEARERRLAEAGRLAEAAGRVAAPWVVEAVAGIDKAAFTRADLIEALGAGIPIDGSWASPREHLEEIAEGVGMRITEARAAHEREGHDRFTAAPMIAEEIALFGLIGGRSAAAVIPAAAVDTTGLSPGQGAVVEALAVSPWLVQVLTAPAGAGKTTSLRALRAAAHAGGKARVLLVAPTGRAVDVALAEGAADHGGTVARAVADLRSGKLTLDPATLLLVDEAGMVGTPALRELLTTAGAAGTKTVLVGDPNQLAPVRARGGMFAQLVADLPWTQHLLEVWRMRDPAERAASLAVRDGDPAAVAAAVGWYRDHERLRIGDPVTMADDAFRVWAAERDTLGVDSLLIADRWEIADALNERIHRATVAADAPTVGGARRHRIGAGDVIITRLNDPTIDLAAVDRTPLAGAPVRNGQRWYVQTVDVTAKTVTARRIDDGAIAMFGGDYLRRHVHHGYAVTIHAAQGATADRCHAVLSVTGNRQAAYVAMTRGREANRVYLYERIAGEGDHEHADLVAPGVHAARRGEAAEAAEALEALLGRDDTARTVVDTAADLSGEQLPEAVNTLLDTRRRALAAIGVLQDKTVVHDDIEVATDPVSRTDAHRPLPHLDVAAELAGLRAELALLESAGSLSHATVYDNASAATLKGLSEEAQTAVRDIVHSSMAVQVLRSHGSDETAAVIRAVSLTAATPNPAYAIREANVLAIPATAAADQRAADRRYAHHVAPDARAAIGKLTNGEWTVPPGTLIVVDDADHLPATHLQALLDHAASTNTKLLLVTDDTTADGVSAALTDALADSLPWAQHLGEGPRRSDSALARVGDHLAAHSDTPVDQAHREAAALLARRHTLAETYRETATPIWRRRSTSITPPSIDTGLSL